MDFKSRENPIQKLKKTIFCFVGRIIYISSDLFKNLSIFQLFSKARDLKLSDILSKYYHPSEDREYRMPSYVKIYPNKSPLLYIFISQSRREITNNIFRKLLERHRRYFQNSILNVLENNFR